MMGEGRAGVSATYPSWTVLRLKVGLYGEKPYPPKRLHGLKGKSQVEGILEECFGWHLGLRERGSNRTVANIAQWGLRNLYSSQNIAWIIKSRRMRWADQIIIIIITITI